MIAEEPSLVCTCGRPLPADDEDADHGDEYECVCGEVYIWYEEVP